MATPCIDTADDTSLSRKVAGSADSELTKARILRSTVWVGLALLFISRISWNVADLDIWHEMALIRESIALGKIPSVDHFAYTPTLPAVVHHEWGAGALAYAAATLFGAPGILILKYSLAAIIAGFCLAVAKSRNRRLLPAFSFLAPAAILFVGAAFSPVRAHLYSAAFVACLLWFLEQDRRGGRRWMVWWLALVPLWLNLHGGFVVGIGLVGVYGVEQCLRRKPFLHLIAAAGAMVCLIVINPFGIEYYRYLWHGLRLARPDIPEWRPLLESFPSLSSVAFLLSLALIVYLCLTAGVRRLHGIAILAVTAAATLLHQRMLPFYAIAWICYTPGYIRLSPRLHKWCDLAFHRRPLFLQAAWLGIAVFFLGAAIQYQPWRLRVPAEGASGEIAYPVGAVEYLANRNFKGNAMVPFSYGAYVSWKLYPAVRVSVDSRYEVAYPAAWVAESLRLYRAEAGWQDTLASYPSDIVLVAKSDRLAKVIVKTSWNRVYTDRMYEIYARPGVDLTVADYNDRLVDGRFP